MKWDSDQPEGATTVLEELEEDKTTTQETKGPSLVLAGEVLPESIPILPVRPRPFFPGLHLPLQVPPNHLPTIQWALETSNRTVGLVLVKDPEGPDTPENLYDVGAAAKILKVFRQDDGSLHVLIGCLERFKIREVREVHGRLFAHVEYHYAQEVRVDPELKAYAMAIVAALRELVQLNPLQSEAIKLFLSRSTFDDPGQLADFAATLTTASGPELQAILAEFDVRKRIDKTLQLLHKELELSRLQQKITKQIEERMSKQQREFFLREQLKAIKKELGLEKEPKVAEIEKFQHRLRTLRLNEEARQAVQEELEKLRVLEPTSPEYTVSRNYVDWLTILPWGKFSKDRFNIDRARQILDRDHYGLEDVKNRILEFIAVGKLKGDIAGSILCLVGPPGVGKTSIGRSIAAALGRKFYRFSLGGMRDEAEIKGHRRTYIGAMPGKIIQALKVVGTANPVIMLDEIDKVGASVHGDPASALLEVLDPEQNPAFRDHYLDVPFDLSNVLFITTANQLDTIPPPLLDRMEIIRLSGYILEEKVEIARRYLIPKALQAHGLTGKQVTFQRDAIVRIVDGWAREAGVRNLEKMIRKILRKCALEISKGHSKRIVIRPGNLEEYLGKPIFTDEELIDPRPGVVTGLAWTSLGGATLQVEAAAIPSRQKGFKQTGQLGGVMVESSEIAYSYAMAHLQDFGGPEGFFDKHFVHLHVPAGATPKDGPSAGITMATALLSMALDRPVDRYLGMTGELTLTGRVLPIGGVKEKVIAARRAGLRRLIFPEGNRKDVDELAEYLKAGLEFIFVRDYREVFAVALGDGAPGDERRSKVQGRKRKGGGRKANGESTEPGAEGR
ncbi:MAG: endopeptidase La [Acidobacteriota bacterium]